MYAFLRSPKWIFGHVLLVVAVVAFVNLGLWQLRRLDQARMRNALVEERVEAAPRPLAEVVDAVGQDADALAYRRVTVRGTYATDQQMMTAPRSREGRPGHLLLTPLRTDHGTGLLVKRGWIPFERDGGALEEQAAPPQGTVELDGVLLPPEPGGGDEPDREFVLRVDPDRLEPRTGMDLLPVLLLLREQRPQQGALPLPVELADLDEGNHLSYAVQWFLFATIAVVGYPLLIRHRARDSEEGIPEPVPVSAGSRGR